jgi:hypothetical protein
MSLNIELLIIALINAIKKYTALHSSYDKIEE